MKISHWFTSRYTFIFAGALLAIYLLIVSSIVNFSQNSLEEAVDNKLHFKVESYTRVLNSYFENTQQKLIVASSDKAITTFFTNKSYGMSMAYGLGASLHNTQAFITALSLEKTKENLTADFSRVSLLSLNGILLADSKEDTPFDRSNFNVSYLKAHEQVIMNNTQALSGIRISTTVYLQNKPVALLIAELNLPNMIEELATKERFIQGSRIELHNQEYAQFLLWDSLSSHNAHIKTADTKKEHELLYWQEEIENTPFLLKAWFEKNNEYGVFTSKWLMRGIFIFAILVFFGLCYLIKTERKNILLKSEISNSKQQRKAISEHNKKLESEIKKRKISEEKLAYQATHDPLTHLPNRLISLKRLSDSIESKVLDDEHKILLMYLDLDHFKQINDTLGHAAGDLALKETSQRLVQAIRKTDTVSRLGGDEFLLIIPAIENKQQAADFALKILNLFEAPFYINNTPFYTTASIGLSLYPDDGTEAEILLKNADMGLYKAKESGRNNFCFYESYMYEEINRNALINVRLRDAINTNALEMYYQPIVNLQTQKIIGAEALMRWTDVELGFISPDEFILVAEKNGLIDKLGSFALNEALQQAANWQKIIPLQMSVNFSSAQFRNCNALLNEIQKALVRVNLPANKLDIEVTESLLLRQEAELIETLSTLREMGAKLSIDDFGTGYSALSYLQRFSFTTLKIDRAFIMNLTTNSADYSLVTAIIAMAKALKLTIVAEGIEYQEQMDLLLDLQCDYGQGYLFSKPVTAVEFEKLLKKQQQAE